MPIKPGLQTSEFWLTIAQTLVSAALSIIALTNKSLADTLTPNVPTLIILTAWVLAAAASTVRYISSRTALKRTAAKYEPATE